MNIITQCNTAQIVVDILQGKTVVFPTETSYGLGCDATSQGAVDAIYKIKGRTPDKPLLVVVPDVEMAKKYLVWNDAFEMLSQKYWPGAVTVVGEYRKPSPPQRRGQGEVPLANSIKRNFSFERIAEDVKKLSFRRLLRLEAMKAEKILWSQLWNKRLGGLKFKRQHGIGNFIVDFLHPETRTIIEIDGDIHFTDEAKVKKDAVRTKWLEDNGYKVIRYNNVDIMNNLQNIVDEIYHNLTQGESVRDLSLALSSAEAREHELASGVVSKDGTVAVRVTANPLLISITQKMGRPLVATSANLADTGDIYDSSVILGQFEGREFQPDIVLNQGVLPQNPPTTIVSVVNNQIKILRQGAVEIY